MGTRFPVTSAIETLELPVSNADGLFAAGRWMALHYPNLRTFIANNRLAVDDIAVANFWQRHQNLERIEHVKSTFGQREWFPHVSHGCFPNLRTLKV
jgi:hypothetical protein